MANGIQLPAGYEDAAPVAASSPVTLPPGYEDAAPVGTPPPGTTGVSGFLNKIGEGGAEAAHDVYGAARSMVPGGAAETGAVKTVWNNLPPVQLYEATKQILPVIHAYEQARSGGAPISESIKAADNAARQHASNVSSLQPVVDAFKANPTRETARAVVDATAAAASLLVGGEAVAPEAAAETTAAEAAPAISVPVKPTNPFRARLAQLREGAGVAQAPAQEATRAAVKAGGAEVGLQTAQPASLRTVAEEPLNVVNGLKKAAYGQVDRAAGTDLKTLYDRLDNINDQIDLTASGSPEEARLEAARTSQMQTIEDAKTAARAKGVDVDQMLAKGDALHTREMAIRDFQKSFLKNPSIVEGNTAMGTPETINVDSGIKTLQRLQDNTKFGAPRLEQALGKDGAKQLLNDMYAAQRAGVKAVDLQKMIGKIIRGLEIAGVGAGIAGGAYTLATK